MKREEFRVGGVFWCGGRAWICTDVGSRVVVAIPEENLRERPAGPPYEWGEMVFDERDQEVCYADRELMVADQGST